MVNERGGSGAPSHSSDNRVKWSVRLTAETAVYLFLHTLDFLCSDPSGRIGEDADSGVGVGPESSFPETGKKCSHGYSSLPN